MFLRGGKPLDGPLNPSTPPPMCHSEACDDKAEETRASEGEEETRASEGEEETRASEGEEEERTGRETDA
ncbi:unnamed protein product [Arctogadus glacialis]